MSVIQEGTVESKKELQENIKKKFSADAMKELSKINFESSTEPTPSNTSRSQDQQVEYDGATGVFWWWGILFIPAFLRPGETVYLYSTCGGLAFAFVVCCFWYMRSKKRPRRSLFACMVGCVFFAIGTLGLIGAAGEVGRAITLGQEVLSTIIIWLLMSLAPLCLAYFLNFRSKPNNLF